MKQSLLAIILIASVACTLIVLGVSDLAQASEQCGKVKTSYISCNADADPSTIEQSAFWWTIEFILNIALSLVGITAVGGVIWASVLYASAQDNETQLSQAKGLIRDIIIGIIAAIAMYSFLQYLVPGGIF